MFRATDKWNKTVVYGGLALALLEVGAFKKQGLPILKKQQKDMLPT